MNQNEKLKLFIGYSHHDNDDKSVTHINNFRDHIKPLKDKNWIEEWYDGKLMAGREFQNDIDDRIEEADIICLFISAHFLASDACLQEKKRAVELKNEKGVVIIPIILSPCGWKEDKDIRKLLALPTDGKPITEFPDSNKAWHDVYQGLKKVIENENVIKQLQITDEFKEFLQDAELLTKAHSNKETVFFEDIFVYPELTGYDDLGEFEDEKISLKKLIPELIHCDKNLITGENQSGKTSLCKILYIELRKKNLVPIYISGKKTQYQGNIENILSKEYSRQYDGIGIDKIDKKRIVPILDDFHFAKKKEKHIDDLSKYEHLLIIVDDIFSLNIKEETLINSFTRYRINEFTPSLRYELIKKWSYLSDKGRGEFPDAGDVNQNYKKIDQRIKLVETALGKALGKGIMPAYPFFILSVIATYETYAQPLNREITSQGYCYQALIYLYLRKEGVKNDEIDTYVNFLSEFSFHLFTENTLELSNDVYGIFIKTYLDKFNFPVNKEELMNKMRKAQIISIDSFNNYSFSYSYLYYFFVAKYLAEHLKDNRTIITSIIDNLHKDENAYIAVFIAHHSKNIEFMNEILFSIKGFFEKHEPATLDKKELKFFDEQVDIIVKAALPSLSSTPENERDRRLKVQDEMEEIEELQKNDEEENYDDLAIEIRRSIKTVEVMGSIIKNRAGSLEKTKLEEIFEEAMKVHLRFLSLFFELIKDGKAEKEIVDFISKRLENEIKTKEINQEQLEKMAKTIFWNLSFFVIYGFIDKIVHSLGSDKLKSIVEKVCNNENNPSSFLIKHGIFMWYDKNLQIKNIIKRTKMRDFSKIAQRTMEFMVVNHASIHQINFADRQKIVSGLGISKGKLYKNPKEE